jgi:DNA (cytosine-5)-methyltransferase 1
LAAQWVWGNELEIVAFCEIDRFCQKVLHKHWPDVPIIEDVRDVTKKIIQDSIRNRCLVREDEKQVCIGDKWESCSRNTEWVYQNEGIDLLTGGFPCQPFSVAGKRKGKEDNRFLWPEMFSVIKEIRPRWVVAENVAGIVRMALDDCLSDLEGEGYSTQAVIIPACAVNAPHRRDRVWIVANSNPTGFKDWPQERRGKQSSDSQRVNCIGRPSSISRECQDVADISKQGLEGEITEGKLSREQQGCFTECDWWTVEPGVGRVAHGVPNRVDRLKSLGNAIVPQVAYQIMKAIKSKLRR